MLLNEEQELEQDALFAQLGIPPPPRPDVKTKNAKMLEALRALVATSHAPEWQGPEETPNFRSQNDPDADRRRILAGGQKQWDAPTSRSILDGIDPMLGPTRAREVKRTIDDHLRSQLTSSPPRQGVTPSGTIQLPPQAGMFGASAPFPAMVSGVVSKLFDDPTDIKGAVIEGMGRGAVAPYQDDVPTVSGEFKQRGYDPGMVGGFLLDAVTDPSSWTPNGSGAAAHAGGAVAMGAPLLLKKLLGRGAKAGAGAVADMGDNVGDDVVRLGDDIADNFDDEAEELIKGSAGWFPRDIKMTLDELSAGMRDQQRAQWVAAGKDPKKFGPRISEIQTAIKNIIRNDISKGDPREAERLIDGYYTTALPSNYRGVNFDERRPVVDLMQSDGAGGVQFDGTTKQRLELAFEQGTKRSEKEQWGDSRWLYHLSDGDPKVAVQITRLLGAFSPGQKTDANTLNAIEAFLRSMRGESADDILGHKVPDPGRPGKMMREGATLSTGHPRPGTVDDNLQRAIQLGRIFNAKVEALAGAELGLHQDIPIDLWLMRAIGASSDSTPGDGAYRLISAAMAKEAALKNQNPFEYMAKVWMGMQDIVGTPTPSFAESAAHIRLPGNVKAPGVADEVLENMDYHGAGVKDRSLPGARSPIATNPQMPFSEWEQAAKDLFLQGKKSDVLGKKTIVQNPNPVTLEDFQQGSQDANRLESMMRGAQRPGSVITNIALEAAPGAKSGVGLSYPLSAQADKEKRDRSLLGSLLDKATGKARSAEALYPGRTAPPIEGQGHWPTPQGIERNLLNAIPIEMQTTPDGRKLDTYELLKALALTKHYGIALGQDAVPATAVQFADIGKKPNVLRTWPSAGEKMPRAGQQLSQGMPSGVDVIQHRDTGADFFKSSGKPLTVAERKTIKQAATGVMTPKGQRGAGARAGRNIAGDAGYVMPQWGAEGSRQATTDLLKTLRKLTSADLGALDAGMRVDAANVLRRLKKDSNTSAAQLNYLKIVATSGVDGLKKALKDPNQLVPVLAMLGLGSTLVSRQSELEPDEQ